MGLLAPSNLIRWSGLVTMADGVLFVADSLLALALPRGDVEILSVATVLLVPVGMVGFHVLQRENYRLIGRAGFWTVVAASLAEALALTVYFSGSSALLWVAVPVGPLALLVGFVLYGAATLQARVLPRWCGIAFIVVMPVTIALTRFGLARGLVWFGLVWLALGYVLWLRKDLPTQRSRAPSRSG